MQRREFITFLGGAAAAWPLTAHAQQHFRIGLLNTGADPFFVATFMGKLEELGYQEGKNIVVERKFAEGNAERLKEFAADLVRQHVDDNWDARRLRGQAGHQHDPHRFRSD